jgi:alanyl aminopeptidase
VNGARERGPRSARRLSLLLAAAGLVGGCGGRARGAPPSASVVAGRAADAGAPVGAPVGTDGRLPATAVPESYDVSLRVDPAKDRFSGVSSIQVSVPAPTWHVVMHARDLHVTRAGAVVGARAVAASAAARTAPGAAGAEELVLTFAEPLPAGSARIELEYDAPFGDDLSGLYRVEEEHRFYAFSQFEATDARRAMPCFDEPGFKAPFQITIAAPRGMIALSNGPEVGTEDAADGMTVHRFAPTPPLPSYLVAFAVGDFDLAEGRKAPVPIRVVTTRGHARLAGPALEAAEALVSRLGDYFDMPYPFAKLDLVAVPDFSAGAMENPGLLMFRDVLLLQDPAHVTTGLRRAQAATIAHELAHQWFGDLVTMQWWDDLWLNEGFATWAEAKIVDSWKPAFGATAEQIAGVGHAMDTDALASARAVREPVRSDGEVKEAFDGLTYDKGAAVLRMIEAWLGPETFRRGVQRYAQSHAWKSARADDLFRALDYVSAERVGQFASSFLDRTGVPEVVARPVCAGGKSTLELRQTEWHPLGSPGKGGLSWTLPVCVVTEGRRGKACFTLGAEPIVRELGPGCPGWVYPNADQIGYYRVGLDRPQLLALARAAGRSLDPVQRLGLVSNAWAAVRAGSLEPSALLEALRLLDGETSRLVLGEIVGVLRGVDDALVDAGSRDAYRSYVAARLGPRKRALGWEPAPGARRAGADPRDDDDSALERQSVIRALGEIARDPSTLAEAETYARRWLKDPSTVTGDVAAVAVPMASIRAGKDRLDELRAAAKGAASLQDRAIALRAMGSFDDPDVLAQAFETTLTGELKLSELRHVFGAALDRRDARPVLYAWEKAHWAKLCERLPGSFGRSVLVGVAGAVCTAAEREDARAFFSEATRGVEGLKRPLDEAVEASGLCVALREHGAASVARFLARP